MDLNRLNGLVKPFLAVAVTCGLGFAMLGNAYASQDVLQGRTDGRVVAQAPRSDAAFVPKLPGMVNNVREATNYNTTRTNNDGIVIRGSYVKDGKVVIPPSGIYLTTRSSNLSRLANDPYVIAGKMYYFIVDEFEQIVIRDVTMKKGDIAWVGSEKARGFELQSAGGGGWYTPDGATATFQILKTSGNYYGSSLPVNYSEKNFAALPEGGKPTKLAEGITMPALDNNVGYNHMYKQSASVGRTWAIVDKITDAGEVHVVELVTDNNIGAYFSPNKPTIGEYAKGEKWTVGAYTMSMDDLTADTATVTITGPDGAVTKKLGPTTNAKYVPTDTAQVGQFWMLSKDGKAIVHLNIRSLMDKTSMVSEESAKAAIAGGKAKVYTYTDVFNLVPGGKWINDDRFLSRPET